MTFTNPSELHRTNFPSSAAAAATWPFFDWTVAGTERETKIKAARTSAATFLMAKKSFKSSSVNSEVHLLPATPVPNTTIHRYFGNGYWPYTIKDE